MALVNEVGRFGVYLVRLDPTQGAEMRKTRTCVVVSPDEMNRHIRTVIVAPMTTATHGYPTRVAVEFQRKRGEIVLDQLRAVDRTRLTRRLSALPPETARKVCDTLVERFAFR